jgi:ABC-type enterochelin transport system substrate-binding protein
METSVKSQMESLYHTFKTEAEQKNIKLKINNTLSEIDNLIRTDEEKISLYYHICFQMQ